MLTSGLRLFRHHSCTLSRALSGPILAPNPSINPTPSVLCRRLVNEMEEIFKAQNYSLVAEASGEGGLYTWNVSLAGFTPGCHLAQASTKTGIDGVDTGKCECGGVGCQTGHKSWEVGHPKGGCYSK